MKYGGEGFKSLLPQKIQLNTSPCLGICLVFWVLGVGMVPECPGLSRSRGGNVAVKGNRGFGGSAPFAGKIF